MNSRPMFGLAFILLSLASCTAVGLPNSGTSSPEPAPSTIAATLQGTGSPSSIRRGEATEVGATVAFTVCQSSDTWVPPTESEQAQHYWDGNPRLEGVSRLALWWEFAQDFVEYRGGASEEYDLWPSFGLWNTGDVGMRSGGTATTLLDPCPLERLITGQETELWVRRHKVLGAERRGRHYDVTVVPATGYEFVRLAGPLAPSEAVRPGEGYAAAEITVVDEGGRVLSMLPPPPWLEAHVNPVDGTEVLVAGVLTDVNARDGYMLLRADDGAEWTLPILSGTVLESGDGASALHTSPAPGTHVEASGFTIVNGVEQKRLAVVRLKVQEP